MTALGHEAAEFGGHTAAHGLSGPKAIALGAGAGLITNVASGVGSYQLNTHIANKSQKPAPSLALSASSPTSMPQGGQQLGAKMAKRRNSRKKRRK